MPLSNTASARWKRRNKTKVKAKLAEWMKAKERRSAYMARYIASRKEIQKAYDAERYLLAENVAKRESQKEEKREYMRRWLKANPGKHRAADGRRKALKRNNAVGSQKIIANWIETWRSKPSANCFWCKKRVLTADCHADHIAPLSKGGAHSIENFCISCASCNQRKHDRNLHFWNRFLSEPVLL